MISRKGSPSAPFTAKAIMAIASITSMACAARLAKKASPVANARIAYVLEVGKEFRLDSPATVAFRYRQCQGL